MLRSCGPKITISRIGLVATTVAVRRSDSSKPISPKKVVEEVRKILQMK